MAEFELSAVDRGFALPPRPLPLDHNRSDVDTWRIELDSYYQQMHLFQQMEPDEIFVALSAFSARASEIRTNLVRVDTRLHTSFRTREIDPFITEVDRQFRTWSRIFAVRTLDWEMSKGQT